MTDLGLSARFDAVAARLGLPDGGRLYGVHPVTYEGQGAVEERETVGKSRLWALAGSVSRCPDRKRPPYAKVREAALQALPCPLYWVWVEYGQDTGVKAAVFTGRVEGPAGVVWYVWSAGQKGMSNGPYSCESEALLAVLEHAAGLTAVTAAEEVSDG
jgi:hypothetical protein